jgi:VIT1/CCC1 family predicted Fe2+/Mn2+ transporter
MSEVKIDVPRYRENYQDEIDSAYLYQVIASIEKQEPLAQVYRRMSEVEREHAVYWKDQLEKAGAEIPTKPAWRIYVLAWLARRFGPGFVLPTIVGREAKGTAKYSGQPAPAEANMAVQERSHAHLLLKIASKKTEGMEGGHLAQLEGRHRGGGNALRAAVLGANDGLVSNLSLVMGVAGADMSAKAIIITGLAGLLAGSASMALGEWLSVQSARELYENQIAIEAREIRIRPKEEEEELALIYQAKGLPKDQAHALAARIMADDSISLDTLAREELGVDPEEMGGSAWVAAFTSFLLFAVGAVIPLFPFLFLSGVTAVLVSLGVSALGLFVIGASITLLTGKNAVQAGIRQILIGLTAAGIIYGIGRLIGRSIGG